MKSIDTKLTTTSMKLVEEKNLLRRKDNIKGRLKDLAGFESSLQDVQALKVGMIRPAWFSWFLGRSLPLFVFCFHCTLGIIIDVCVCVWCTFTSLPGQGFRCSVFRLNRLDCFMFRGLWGERNASLVSLRQHGYLLVETANTEIFWPSFLLLSSHEVRGLLPCTVIGCNKTTWRSLYLNAVCICSPCVKGREKYIFAS